MSLFEVKLSGNPSFGVSRTISNTLTHLNERYLDGHRDKTTVIVEYLARDLWFVKGRSLSDLDQNLLTITVTPPKDLSEDDRATFVMATFHAFDEVIGDLHGHSFIRIANQTGSFVYYKYFQDDK